MERKQKAKHHLGVFLEGPTSFEAFSGLDFITQDSALPVPDDEVKVYVVPHTHADLCWPEIPDYCIDACLACIDDLIKFQDDAPGFRFSMEHAYYLRKYLERNPGSTETVINLINQGFFECGAFYLGPTELTAGGESLIRELYLGKRWLKETFNIDSKVAWNVDCPGHTLQLPQILKQAGVPYFVIWKEFNLFEHDFSGYSGPCTFRWKSPDGSNVLTSFTPGGYGIGRMLGFRDSFDKLTERLPRFLEDVTAHLESYDLPKMILIADGTDVERPTLDVIKNIKLWNERFRHPQIELATATEYFDRISQSDLPMSTGEGPNWWDTIGSFQNDRVMTERRCEPRQAAAEAFSAIAALIDKSYEYPNTLIERIWENRLFASEHNSGGRNGMLSDAIKLSKVKSARVLTDIVLNQSLAEIGLHVKFQQKGVPIIIFNTLLWPRQDLVSIDLHFSKAEIRNIKIVDHLGDEMDFQIERLLRYGDESIKDCRLLLSLQLPAMGYTTVYLVDEKPEIDPQNVLTIGQGSTYENRWFKFTVDPQTGYPISLVDKQSDAELVDPSEFQFGELIALENLAHDEDEHLTGKYWRCVSYQSKVWLAENGPLRATWLIEGEFKGSLRRQRFIFYRDLKRVDVDVEIDWQGEPDLQIMQTFPFVAVSEKDIDYGVPFGHSKFLEENPDWTKIHPSVRGVRDWVHINSQNNGITLATEVIPFDFRDRINLAKPGALIQPILIKTTYSCHDHLEYLGKMNLKTLHSEIDGFGKFDFRPENPHVRWDQTGHHRFHFSLCLDEGYFNPAQSARFSMEHQAKFLAFVHYKELDQFPHLIAEKIRNRLAQSDRSLPENLSFIRCKSKTCVPTWVKQAEDGDGVIIRSYEADGTEGAALFETYRDIGKAWETDIIEYDQSELSPIKNQLSINTAPYEIKTTRIKFD